METIIAAAYFVLFLVPAAMMWIHVEHKYWKNRYQQLRQLRTPEEVDEYLKERALVSAEKPRPKTWAKKVFSSHLEGKDTLIYMGLVFTAGGAVRSWIYTADLWSLFLMLFGFYWVYRGLLEYTTSKESSLWKLIALGILVVGVLSLATVWKSATVSEAWISNGSDLIDSTVDGLIRLLEYLEAHGYIAPENVTGGQHYFTGGGS